jgi:hypothetical protein
MVGCSRPNEESGKIGNRNELAYRGVACFLESRYPSLRLPVECPEFGCTIAALQDLAAFKLLAITG